MFVRQPGYGVLHGGPRSENGDGDLGRQVPGVPGQGQLSQPVVVTTQLSMAYLSP